MPDAAAVPRPIRRAELLAIGTELTVGETTDTNSGDLARSLVAHGVTVLRVASLPDDLEVVVAALGDAVSRADLVVTTGGLGPTPDDLTREAVAALTGEAVEVDPPTLEWLRDLWARRGQAFPEVNTKQAWRTPSASMLANPNGTAPGWWVDRSDGGVIVTLPGPPREMRPMWQDEVLPRLLARGVGGDSEVRTLRLTGIGESVVAERLGEDLLRRANPVVATYARTEAVDVRISARPEDGRQAAAVSHQVEATILALVGDHVWARGDTTWAAAIGDALRAHGWSLATTERGTDGALVQLLRPLPGVRLAERRASPAAVSDASPGGPSSDHDQASTPETVTGEAATHETPEVREAARVRASAGADVGLAIRVAAEGADTMVHVGIVTPEGIHAESRVTFMRGNQGADRAAIAAAAVLLSQLRGTPNP